MQDGIDLSNQIQQRFVKVVGADKLDFLTDTLEVLCAELKVEVPRYQLLEAMGREHGQQPQRLNLLLPILSNFFYQALIDALSEKGFTGLKPNFSEVLGLVILGQGRIQYIAAVTGVRKQAIAVTANELEQLGYINKDIDPHDKLQIVLRLAPLGQKLLDESKLSVEALLKRIERIVGNQSFEVLETTVAALYAGGIEHHQLPNAMPNNIE